MDGLAGGVSRPALARGRAIRRGTSHDVLFYKFLQWQIDRQLAEAQAHAHRARA